MANGFVLYLLHDNLAPTILNQYITKAYVSFLIGKTVVDYSYSPNLYLISLPHQIVNQGWYGNTHTANFKWLDKKFGLITLNSGQLARNDTVDISEGIANTESAKVVELTKKKKKKNGTL